MTQSATQEVASPAPTPSKTQIPLSAIVFDEGLYPRVEGHNPALVETYIRDIEQIEAAGKWISVNAHGVLLDGKHRWLAYKTKADGTDPLITVDQYNISSDLESFRLACALQDRGFALNDNDRIASAKKMLGLGMTQVDIAAALGVARRTVGDWLARTIKDQKEAAKKKAYELWLACYTQEEIAAATGVPRQTITDWTKDFAEMAESADSAKSWVGFEPPIYNVWKQQSKSNAVSHFGNSEQRWLENLLWLYARPGSVVVDPFGGGGSTIDVCKKHHQRYFISDRKPKVSRETEIRKHDLTKGLPKVPWKDVSLVYLDPPYWKQAENQYSEDPEDLANMELAQFNATLSKIIKDFAKKLKESAGAEPAYIALIIQPTQWKAPERQFTDHVGDMLRAINLPVDMRYSVPYESQQCTAQMVTWAKEERRCLVLTREIIVWKVA